MKRLYNQGMFKACDYEGNGIVLIVNIIVVIV